MRICLIRSIAFIALLVAGFVGPAAAQAQDQNNCQIALQMAQTEYDEGYFENASDRLYTCIGKQVFTEEEELRAYLLLGRIHYANLQRSEARDSIRRALDINPAIQLDMRTHKPGFVELLEEVRSELDIRELPPRRGFWFSFGIGPANAEMDCSGCGLIGPNDPWHGGGGGSFHIALGGTLNPNWQLGAELNHWGSSADVDHVSNINILSVIARYYPNEYGQFFIRGGLGIGGATVESQATDFRLSSGGMGMQLGVGYDFLLGQSKQTSITPYFNIVFFGAQGEVREVGDFLFRGPSNPGYFQFGVAFSVL